MMECINKDVSKTFKKEGVLFEMEENKPVIYRWRGVRKVEVVICLVAWVVMFILLPQDTKEAWITVGVFLILLVLKSYGSGIDYNENEWTVYSFGKKKFHCSWDELKEIQVVSKRTGLLWRKHYALGFFVWDEINKKNVFLGVSPTVVLNRLEKELGLLKSQFSLLDTKLNVQRLTEEEQFRCFKAISLSAQTDTENR